VSNMVEMTVHAGTHIDSPHHFVREHPGVAELPVANMISDAVVLDLSFRGQANARITPEDLEQAERALNAHGHRIEPGGTVLLRTDWPKGHVTTDPTWWNESPCPTRKAARRRDPRQRHARAPHDPAKGRLPVENLINLDQIPPRVRLLALPAKWRSESAPARVLALVDEG